MRPGREAPENVVLLTLAANISARFNEAGARSPGKRRCNAMVFSLLGCFNEAGARSPGKRR